MVASQANWPIGGGGNWIVPNPHLLKRMQDRSFDENQTAHVGASNKFSAGFAGWTLGCRDIPGRAWEIIVRPDTAA